MTTKELLNNEGRLNEPIVDIAHNGKTFRYKFNDLTVLQCELGRECGEHRALQIEQVAPTFQMLVDSGGATWLLTVASYLLRQLQDDGTMQPFVLERSKGIFEWLSNINCSEMPKLEALVVDFFYAIGKQSVLSNTLFRTERNKKIEALSKLSQVIDSMSKNVDMKSFTKENAVASTKASTKKMKQKR